MGRGVGCLVGLAGTFAVIVTFALLSAVGLPISEQEFALGAPALAVLLVAGAIAIMALRGRRSK
jgi:hypothetical protein